MKSQIQEPFIYRSLCHKRLCGLELRAQRVVVRVHFVEVFSLHALHNSHLLENVPFSLSSEAFLGRFLQSAGLSGAVQGTVVLSSS